MQLIIFYVHYIGSLTVYILVSDVMYNRESCKSVNTNNKTMSLVWPLCLTFASYCLINNNLFYRHLLQHLIFSYSLCHVESAVVNRSSNYILIYSYFGIITSLRVVQLHEYMQSFAYFNCKYLIIFKLIKLLLNSCIGVAFRK